MHLFLEPMDVWLFRDGKSFDAGSDHRAVSIFPPYPTVIQGAVRSHHLVVKNVDLRDADAITQLVGTAEDYRQLRIRGPFLAEKTSSGEIERYFPVPADVVYENGQVQSLNPCHIPDGVIASNVTPDLLILNGQSTKADIGKWLSESHLHKCLKGEKVRPIPDRNLFVRESRFGIGLDDSTHTVEEGKLYEVEFIRTKPGVGLSVEVQGYDGWPDAGIMRIGGEGRGAFFAQVNDVSWSHLPNPLPTLFKIYFATPTYFKEGWRPSEWDRFFDGSVELKAAAVNRYESVGGYDWAQNAHKPARRFVPAGSVYYFESKGRASLKSGLVQNAITDYGAEIGFGQIIVEEWSYV